MVRQPWFKFYSQDWLGDSKLRACGATARGVWIDLIAVMHDANPYGECQLSVEAIARVVGLTRRRTQAVLQELEANGVFSRTEAGHIYSRRMKRDVYRRAVNQENGRHGGNPALVNRNKAAPDNRVVKPIEARSQKPEARPPSTTGERRAPLVATHRSHAQCGKVCLPSALFQELVQRATGAHDDPDAYVRAWFHEWNDRYATGDRKTEIIGQDAFDFWRARWKESHDNGGKTSEVTSAMRDHLARLEGSWKGDAER